MSVELVNFWRQTCVVILQHLLADWPETGFPLELRVEMSLWETKPLVKAAWSTAPSMNQICPERDSFDGSCLCTRKKLILPLPTSNKRKSARWIQFIWILSLPLLLVSRTRQRNRIDPEEELHLDGDIHRKASLQSMETKTCLMLSWGPLLTESLRCINFAWQIRHLTDCGMLDTGRDNSLFIGRCTRSFYVMADQLYCSIT